jgi:hypothetical protein
MKSVARIVIENRWWILVMVAATVALALWS